MKARAKPSTHVGYHARWISPTLQRHTTIVASTGQSDSIGLTMRRRARLGKLPDRLAAGDTPSASKLSNEWLLECHYELHARVARQVLSWNRRCWEKKFSVAVAKRLSRSHRPRTRPLWRGPHSQLGQFGLYLNMTSAHCLPLRFQRATRTAFQAVNHRQTTR